MNGEAHPSRLALDLALIGAAEAADAAHIGACARCRGRLERMEKDRDAFLTAHPQLAAPKPKTEHKRRLWIPALAAAAAILAVVFLARPPQNTERMKGGTHVELWVKRGAESFAFDGRALATGDTLLFRYTTTRKHLTVIDAEASGKIAVVIDQPIEPGTRRTAPTGVALDDYRGEEKIIALFSDGPLDKTKLETNPTPADLPADRAEWKIERSSP
jgi:hypothetical protein